MNVQKSPASAKSGNIIFMSRNSVGYVIWTLIKLVVSNFFNGLLMMLIALIPVIGIIIAVIDAILMGLVTVFTILEMIIYCCTSTKITTTGIHGYADNCWVFDLPANQISFVTHTKKNVEITGTIIKKNGKQVPCTYTVRMANAAEFVQAYRENKIHMVTQ